MKRQFYVYIHYKPNGDPFYVGKGIFERANSLKPRNPHHKNILLKYGTDNIIVQIYVCDSETHALQREVELIAQFRSEGFILTNMTDGGEGVSGLIQSQESIAKRGASIKAAYALNPKVISQEQRETARINAIKQGFGYSFFGKKRSDVQKAKNSKASMGNKSALGPHDVSEEGRRRMGDVNKGTKRALGHAPSDQVRAEWSRKRKAYAQTPEGKEQTKRRIEAARIANRGNRHAAKHA